MENQKDRNEKIYVAGWLNLIRRSKQIRNWLKTMRTDAITPVRNRPSTVFLPDMIAFKYTLCSVNSKQHMHLVYQIISNYIKWYQIITSTTITLFMTYKSKFYYRHVSVKRPNMDRDVLFRTVLLVIHWVCWLSLCLLEAHAWCQSEFRKQCMNSEDRKKETQTWLTV